MNSISRKAKEGFPVIHAAEAAVALHLDHNGRQ